MPIEMHFQDAQRVLFLLLRDVVPCLLSYEADETRPCPTAGPCCAKRRAYEVAKVRLALLKPVRLHGLIEERQQPRKALQVLRENVFQRRCGELTSRCLV